MGIDNAIRVTSLKEWDALIQDVRTGIKTVDAITFGSDFKKTVNWETVLTSLSTYIPNLQYLSLSQQNIFAEDLRCLSQLQHLKELSLYWSNITNNNKFFSQLPATLESLDFSRTRVCMNNDADELKKLLERLTHLKSLNLASTQLNTFPRLTKPHESLTTLELYHHDWGNPNMNLDAEDLKNIFINFPNLKSLNIIACRSIGIRNPKVVELINRFAEIEGSSLYADGEITYYFNQCKNIIYIKKHFNFSEDQFNLLLKDFYKIEELASPAVKFLLEKAGRTPQEIIQLYERNLKTFVLLNEPGVLCYIEKNYLSYDELIQLCDKHGRSLLTLMNFDSLYLMNEKQVPFTSLLALFEKNPRYLAGMISFSSRYDKTKEMIEAEIAMLLSSNGEDKAVFKKLDKQNYEMKSFILDNKNGMILSGNDIANILYNFPALESLDMRLHVQLSGPEKDTLIAKKALEDYCLTHPNFTLTTSSYDMSELYRRACGIKFYVQTCGVPIQELYELEKQHPEQFNVLMYADVQHLMTALSLNFTELSVLYLTYQYRLITFGSYEVREFLEDKLLSFKELTDLYNENHEKFNKLINYRIHDLMKDHGVTWDKINQIYAKDPNAFNEFCVFDTKEMVYENIHKLLHIDKVEKLETQVKTLTITDESKLNEPGLERDKKQLSTADNIVGLFYNTKLRFHKDQADLAAKWYLSIVEKKIPNIYQQRGFTSKKMELALTFEQKLQFVESLSKNLWFRLSQDVSLNIKGQNSLYLNWSNDYITQALKDAKIDIDNSKQLNIFAFIGHKGKTSYQLGDEVGSCKDYLEKAEQNLSESFKRLRVN